MKKNFVTLLFVFLISCADVFSQCLPSMFVSRENGKAWIEEFNHQRSGEVSKYKKLVELLGTQDLSLYFAKQPVFELLDKLKNGAAKNLRIYFARYQEGCGGAGIPATEVPNRVILLFAPVVDIYSEPNEYYFIDGHINDTKLYPVSSVCAKVWICDYETNIAKALTSTTNANDPDNESVSLCETTKHFSDTKSIYYPGDNLEEALRKELTYNHIITATGVNFKIDRFKISYSAFTKDGGKPEPGGAVRRFKKRLLLQIDYVDRSNNVLYFEQLRDFNSRAECLLRKYYPGITKNKLKISVTEKLWKLFFYLDNGQLCPTYCPSTK